MVQPTYPLTAGMSQTQMRSVATLALQKLGGLSFPPEWIDRDLMREKGWPSFGEALLTAHNPQEEVSRHGVVGGELRRRVRQRDRVVACRTAAAGEKETRIDRGLRPQPSVRPRWTARLGWAGRPQHHRRRAIAAGLRRAARQPARARAAEAPDTPFHPSPSHFGGRRWLHPTVGGRGVGRGYRRFVPDKRKPRGAGAAQLPVRAHGQPETG